jgi:hypothetical protein
MADFIFIGMILIFLLVSYGFVGACERLRR